MDQKYDEDETIKYFNNPKEYYQNKVAKKEEVLNEQMGRQENILERWAKDLLDKTRIKVALFQKILDDYNFADIDIYDFFQFYKNGQLLDEKVFEDEERDVISQELFKFYMDILFQKYEKLGNEQIHFTVNSISYSIKVQQKFTDIYDIYVIKVNDRGAIEQYCSLLVELRKKYYENFDGMKVVSLKAMIDGFVQKIDKINEIDKDKIKQNMKNYTNYYKEEICELKKDLMKRINGCNWSCKFCNA